MSDTAGLERGYGRLLACYPRAFRRENGDEILAVLMASARPGQRRPGLAESADLIRSALWMRLRPGTSRPPRTVLTAVRLMCVGAALELATLITVVVTTGSVHSAITSRYPGFTGADWHAIMVAHIIPDEVGAPVAVGLWLWMAWANGRGHGWARVVFSVFFGLSTFSLLAALAQDAAVYAQADLVAGVVVWLVEFAVMVLIFNVRSAPFYRHEPPHRSGRQRSPAESAAS
jgi:hypothetical protein